MGGCGRVVSEILPGGLLDDPEAAGLVAGLVDEPEDEREDLLGARIFEAMFSTYFWKLARML